MELELDDLWDDACLVDTYVYLRRGTHACVPDTWHDVFQKFDAELRVHGYEI